MIRYKNLTIITSDNVYIPAEDSFLAAEVLEDEIKKMKSSSLSVLDMGTGSGILGLVAAQSDKVGKVVFADVNAEAVNICKENISFNSGLIKSECEVAQSDLFSTVKEKFDIIIFNAPYLRPEKEDKNIGDLAKAWSGGAEGIETSIKFLEKSTNHLKANGKIILVASSHSNIEKLRSEAKKIGFKKEDEKKIHIFFEDIVAITFSLF